MNSFINYLNLQKIQFDKFDLIVFYGCSGSGKSTQIQQLLKTQYPLEQVTTISAAPIPWKKLLHDKNSLNSFIYIDEIQQHRELSYLRLLLAKQHKLFVASHVKPAWFFYLRTQYKTCIINLDQHSSKIAMRLEQLKLTFSQTAITHYIQSYGASFTEIDIILERHPDTNFDQALSRFQKLNSITLSPRSRPLRID
ncbi:hypothetical protein MNBD_GAMMA12-2862 [hydrothermal vent metagenome]|uniref:Uncharacterized protein n=1 Tax=hydrothermal vent metagenome TaxID=652676 RepID=A0A3B0ZGJ0_9ZZZZ